MGPGREPGHAHIADDLALLYMRADADAFCEARHMAVKRRDAVAMRKHHGTAVAASLALEAHATVAGGMYRGADRRCIVGSHVAADEVQDRMQAVRVEHRADSRKFHRRAQEGFAH